MVARSVAQSYASFAVGYDPDVRSGYVADPCPDCHQELPLRVLESAAGHYIGRFCACGPYSRDSGYYATREEAEAALDRLMGFA